MDKCYKNFEVLMYKIKAKHIYNYYLNWYLLFLMKMLIESNFQNNYKTLKLFLSEIKDLINYYYFK